VLRRPFSHARASSGEWRKPANLIVWALFALTVLATLYFGWHYVLDDVAGMAIAIASLALARVLTRFELGTARARVPAPHPSPA